MNNCIKKIAIIGCGGFARELACNLTNYTYKFFISKHLINSSTNLKNIGAIEDINFSEYSILFGIGDSILRKKLVNMFPVNTNYYTYIDKRAYILDENTVNIGKGSVICAGSILTTNINIGDFSQINLNTTIGHDCNIGQYFTSSPGVNISGNVNMGNLNYCGTNSAIINNVNIVDNVIIGMNSCVIKDINCSGTYVGNPLRKIK